MSKFCTKMGTGEFYNGRVLWDGSHLEELGLYERKETSGVPSCIAFFASGTGGFQDEFLFKDW